MIRRIGLGTLIFLISITLLSQENYITGYIIMPGNDTIYGLIDYRNWEKNPGSVDFKGGSDDIPITFRPTEITEFGVEDDVYVGAIIETEVTPTVLKLLKHDPALNIEKDTIFLQTILRGKKELYYYKNKDSRVNFYIRQGSEFQLLIYKQFLKRIDIGDVVTENKNYQGQLVLYLNDCPDIRTRLNNASYTMKSINSIFSYYYKCTSSDINYKKPSEKLSAEIGLLAGVSLTSIEFVSVYFEYLARADINKSVNFSGGIFFDLILPRNQGKWSINNELFLSSFSFNTSYDDEFNNAFITTELAYTYLKINNLVRFKYPVGPVYLFVNGGISNGWVVKEINLRKSDYYTANRVEEEPALYVTKGNERGLIIGAGLKYNRFSFEARLEKGEGMSRYVTLGSSTTRYHFLFGYKF